MGDPNPESLPPVRQSVSGPGLESQRSEIRGVNDSHSDEDGPAERLLVLLVLLALVSAPLSFWLRVLCR